MLAVIILIVLVVAGLAFYAMRSKVRLKVNATALKWFTFSIEVGSDDRRGELPPSDGGPTGG